MNYLQPVVDYLSEVSGLDAANVYVVLAGLGMILLGYSRRVATAVITGSYLPVGPAAKNLLKLLDEPLDWKIDGRKLKGPKEVEIDLWDRDIEFNSTVLNRFLNRRERRLVFGRARVVKQFLAHVATEAKRKAVEAQMEIMAKALGEA